MTADWLYPLSSSADYSFVLANRRTLDTSPTSFEQMVHSGAIDHTWGAYKNWKNMRPGHRVWVYYGVADGDLGIVGLARVVFVEAPSEPGGRAAIHLDWDRMATRRLLANPYPATDVRKFVPRPQGAAWAIPDALAAELQSYAHGAPTKSALPTKYGNAKKSTIFYAPPKSVKVNRRHDALLRPIETRLRSAGWELHTFDIGAKSADLVMHRKGQLVLVEAKTVGVTTSQAVREAFAQLAEYTWRYQQSSTKAMPVIKWALFEREPATDETRFLEDHDIRVTWASRSARRLFHGPRTAEPATAAGL